MQSFQLLVTFLTFFIIYFAPTPSIAAQSGHNRLLNIQHILSRLELSDNQGQEIQLMIEQNRSTLGSFKDDRDMLRNLIQSKVWNETEVSQAIKAQQYLHTQLMWLNIQTQHQIWETLSPTQQSIFLAELNAQDDNAKRTKVRNNERRQMRPEKRFAALNLTDEQNALLQEQHTVDRAFKEKNKDVRKTFKTQLISIITSENLDESKWIALQEKTSKKRFEQTFAKAKNQHAFWNTLSREQQQTLQNMLSKQKERRVK
jgi:Spy/CpxP family protein refolding chaperone